MAYTRLSMRKTREILRLHHSAALSNRAIARSLKLSASTVSECLGRARAAGVRWPLPTTLTDTACGAGALSAATAQLAHTAAARVGHRTP